MAVGFRLAVEVTKPGRVQTTDTLSALSVYEIVEKST